MRQNESPETAFSALFNRRAVPPNVVIYDDACKLSAYALTRQPEFFANCRFFSDRFHFVDHVGCAEGFNINNFHHYDSLNTESGEQGWSKMCFVVNPAQFMTPAHFLMYVRCFLEGYNADKVEVLRKKAVEGAMKLRRMINPLGTLPVGVLRLLRFTE
jgi:hypothetical protein